MVRCRRAAKCSTSTSLSKSERKEADQLANALKQALADLDETPSQDASRMQKAYSAVAAGFDAYSDVIPSEASAEQICCVIGAGAGLGTAWHLHQQGCAVSCLIRGSTSRSRVDQAHGLTGSTASSAY